MTRHDKELINEARSSAWEEIPALIEKAQSQTAKDEMHRIQMRKYYKEVTDDYPDIEFDE